MTRLALNTATTKFATLAECVQVAADAGLTSIGPWRDRVAEAGLENAARLIRDAGLSVSSLCRGGFLTAADAEGQAAALADNKAAIVEAATLGTSELVLVVGGLPANPEPGAAALPDGDRDLVAARQRVRDRVGELVPFAAEHGVRLVLEPLHPMFAADRAVLSTLGQCLDLAADFPVESVGVLVDTYHVWWDPDLENVIARAGREGRLALYQVCDWLLPLAADPLLSRGFMGDGYIDFPTITRWVAQAGYTGAIEVEIFNQEIWEAPAAQTVATMAERYAQLVEPSLEGRTDR
ncbi:sugar phosphate isomerase/epimerase family protein [Pseudactinotalea sp.]|uniref:sugar phosphate isomerase/epimerase family protein n=1 Tax=Pseudactinotalea sp. TaxID=1926260 RepID=UPI003B3A0D1D